MHGNLCITVTHPRLTVCNRFTHASVNFIEIYKNIGMQANFRLKKDGDIDKNQSRKKTTGTKNLLLVPVVKNLSVFAASRISSLLYRIFLSCSRSEQFHFLQHQSVVASRGILLYLHPVPVRSKVSGIAEPHGVAIFLNKF